MFEDSAHDTHRRSKTVLVLGEDTRSFLSVVRSLGRAGYQVDVVCYDRQSPAARSKYISNRFYYNYQAYSQQEWLVNVLHLLEMYQYDLLVPCDERAIYPLWQSRHLIPSHTHLSIANEESLDVLFDKWKTKQVALKCDVPVAHGELVDMRKCSYQELVKTFGSSFVVKPLQSFESTSLSRRNKVVIVKSEGDFAELKASLSLDSMYLVEDFFYGRGEAIAVFSVEGHVHAAFAYRRLAEPEFGGGSSYRESIPLDDALLGATKRMCESTKLTGVAMFEFRRNEASGGWILIEVNARFWGGLPLAVASGIDFPAIYADYLCFGRLPENAYEYCVAFVARALTQDMYEIRREVEKLRKQDGSLAAKQHLLSRLLGFLNVVTPQGHIDSFAKDDIRPFLSETNSIVLVIISNLTKRSAILTTFRRRKERAKLRRLFKVNPQRRILFICYGNIMRSPFAEYCFNDEKFNLLEADSFGFLQKEERQSPEEAIEAATILQYDLAPHRSKCLSQTDLKPSDILIYFDEKNRNIVQSNYRVYHSFCAADLLDSTYPKETEIADPYGMSTESITQCYERISNSVRTLLEVYQEATK